jgi:hypothetical protein
MSNAGLYKIVFVIKYLLSQGYRLYEKGAKG